MHKNTESSTTDLSNPDQSNTERMRVPEVQEEVKERLNYDSMILQYDKARVDEIVGLITDTKEGLTRGRGRRGNRPYMFINFKPWRPGVDTFRLVLWSEILDQFAGMGVNSVSGGLTNKYVSVVGMINVFKSPKFGVAYQLVPTAAKQVQLIDKSEFDFRLGRTKKQLKQSFGGILPSTVSATELISSTVGSNADKLRKITSGKAQRSSPSSGSSKGRSSLPSPSSSTPCHLTPSSNADRLKKLQGRLDSGRSTSTQVSQKPTAKPRKGFWDTILDIIVG